MIVLYIIAEYMTLFNTASMLCEQLYGLFHNMIVARAQLINVLLIAPFS